MPNRRALLIGVLALPAVLRHPRAQPAPATAPAPAPANPAFYRFKVGSYTATTVHDGFATRPVEGLILNKPLPEVQAALRAAFLPTDILVVPFTVTFIDTGRHLVAFDTGNGPNPNPNSGKLWENMAAANIDPARVTHVVMSHFHGDHIGGLIEPSGAPKYPQAAIIVPETEWRFWTDAANETRTPEYQRGTFANTARRFAPYKDRVQVLADGAEAVPGIRAVAAYGHTPGHTAYHVADGPAEMIYLADTTNRPAPLAEHPDFHPVFDFDADMAEASRRRMFDRVATDRVAVTGYHFPFPAYGHMDRTQSGYHFVPAEWSSIPS